MLIRLAKLTHTSEKKLNLQRRNSELAKKFGARRRVLLRRLRGGGQSARSSLNVIGCRHTVEYGSPKLAFILDVILRKP